MSFKVKQYFIKTGFWDVFKIGKKAPGLHLNRLVRDILRECGIPCPNCLDSSTGGLLDPLTCFLQGVPIVYEDVNGDKQTACSLDLPMFADDGDAAANNYPVNGLYFDADGVLRKRIA